MRISLYLNIALFKYHCILTSPYSKVGVFKYQMIWISPTLNDSFSGWYLLQLLRIKQYYKNAMLLKCLKVSVSSRRNTRFQILETRVITPDMTYLGISSRRNTHLYKIQVRLESPRGSGNGCFVEAKREFP